MTLAQAITKLQTRFGVYQHAEIDATDDAALTLALNVAGQKFAKDTLSFWESQAAITLTIDQAEYDLTSAAVCAARVFYPVGVYINGVWLYELTPDQFFNTATSIGQASGERPGFYTLVSPNKIRIATPPNAAAVAATNYVRGWRFPATLDSGSTSTELEGPSEWHDLIVDRAYLDNSVSYGLSNEALQMRAAIQNRYEVATRDLDRANRNRYRRMIRSGDRIGETRRVSTFGSVL